MKLTITMETKTQDPELELEAAFEEVYRAFDQWPAFPGGRTVCELPGPDGRFIGRAVFEATE